VSEGQPAERGTVKTSTILIAAGRRMAVYRAIEDVPPMLRRRLLKSTAGPNAGTVLIADRRGARELQKARIRSILEQRVERAPGFWPLLCEDFRFAKAVLGEHWRGFSAAALFLLLAWVVVLLLRH